jgi:hypothetical protein
MSVRYIGSKARLIDAIIPMVGKPGRRSGAFVDAFCGTGVVAEAAARADGLAALGELSVVPLKEVGRYRPNRAASDAGSAVTEYLIVVDRRKVLAPGHGFNSAENGGRS